jgi:hypothetical protein
MGKMTTKQALNDLDKLGRYVKGNLNTMSDSEIVHEIAHFLDIRKGVFTVEEASNFSEEDGIIETFKNTNVVEINAFLNEINFINDYKGFNTYADVVNTIMNPEYDAVGKEKLLQLTEFKNIIMQFFDFPQSEVFPSVK